MALVAAMFPHSRGGKGSLYEGGIRIPFFVEGPSIEAGSISHESIMGCDLFPTFCVWAGVETPEGLEGVSLAAVLSGRAQQLVERSILFHYPHYGQGVRQKPQSALIRGDYKILYDWESASAALFNLSKDHREQNDLSGSEPQRAAALLAELRQRLNDVQASLPTPNPNYDPKAEVPSRPNKKR